MKLIQPVSQGAELVAQMRNAKSLPGAFQLWWLGQSGFLVHWNRRYLLFDPYLSDSLTTKYAETDKPHIRMTKLAVAPHQLDFVDVVTSSHNHTDHLDGETLIPLIESNPDVEVVCPAANVEFVADRLGVAASRLLGVSDGQSVECSGFEIHGLPAAHDEIERDSCGHPRCMGYVVRFGEWAIYHSGDTLLYEGLSELVKPFQPNIALLPINGKRPERRVAGNLWGDEAAELARDISADCVIPCHFEMFTFNTESPDRFKQRCIELGLRYYVLKCGQTFCYPADDQAVFDA